MVLVGRLLTEAYSVLVPHHVIAHWAETPVISVALLGWLLLQLHHTDRDVTKISNPMNENKAFLTLDLQTPAPSESAAGPRVLGQEIVSCCALMPDLSICAEGKDSLRDVVSLDNTEYGGCYT